MKRPTITLACIMKNEAENLPRFMKSVEDCFDEIILTDTGSTDNSVEIAKSLGAKVKHFEWINDFSAARNFSFEGITTDFTMWLDLDDVLENKQGFLNFRNDAMAMGDYWIASYHYTSNAEGKSLCTFARERVVRTNKNLKWKYFVHEGILPTPEAGPIRMQFTPVWAVRHMRTEADLLKDRSRNLSLFQDQLQNLDARMKYYYGKELFEAQRPADAVVQLGDALKSKELELHDRILAMQYISYAYIQCNQFEQAMQMANQGTILAPHRAEFYSLIGDCFIKLGRPGDAVPSYSAAKACQIQVPQGYAAAIFHNEEAYGPYPSCQLARVYGNMGDLDRSEKEAQACFDQYTHPESKLILDEVKRLKLVNVGFKDAKPCDDIVITCPPHAPYLWDADLAKERSMGGSEIACIEMAYWLHKKSGRPVKVFNVRETTKVCDGVEYIPCGQAPAYMNEFKPWLHIAWRHNFKVTDAKTFVWCHDLQTQGVENIVNYEKALCLTPFHQRYMTATQGVPLEKIFITSNGLNPTRFKPIDHSKKDPNKFIFSSSPDRGLDRAMRVLDKVRIKHPDIKLHIYYGWDHLPMYGMTDLMNHLKKMAEERKDWIVYHGATQQDKMIEEFESAAYCVQPSDWIETSKITAMEHLCAGVYQITRAIGGCIDTMDWAVKNRMATLVDSECITEAEHDVYVEATLKAMDEEAYKRIKVDPQIFSWEYVAEEWLANLPHFAYGQPEVNFGTE